MKFSKDLMDHLANLARIELSPEEKARYFSDFSSILGYVEKIQKKVVKDASLIDERTVNVWRDDVAQGCLPEERQAVVDSFPEKEGELLKVRGVFE